MIYLFNPIFAFSQSEEVEIELGKRILQPEESFTIKIIIRNHEKWEVSQFPIIQGFTKESKLVSHAKTVLDGKKVPVHTITQTYLPTKGGTFRLPSYTFTVNGKEFSTEPISIMVALPKEDEESPTEEISIDQIKSNAFLSLSTDKNKVFVGEGFKITLTFYLAESNTANINFTDDKDLNAQIDAIAKKIKPANCLEQRIHLTQINAVPITINNQKYSGYKIFEAIYFPLNNKAINFPVLDFRMNHLKTNNTKENIIFNTKSFTISIVELPDHPQKDKVAVGEYYLFEEIDKRKIRTGKTFNYYFKIVGNGNFSTINLENITNDSHFDFYPPSVKTINQTGQLKGEKEFRFRIMPKDSGTHQLSNYFSWVFFNTKKQTYDTLKSRLNVVVSGKTIADEDEDSEDIYAGIDKLETSKFETDYQSMIKNIGSVIIFLMFVGTFFLFDFTKNK